MRIQTLDLKAQYASIRDEVRQAVDRVLESQVFILGPEVAALEDEVAAYSRCGHAVGMSSGTDALLAALMAIDIGPGDEVVTTPYTFFATAGTVHRLGARPVFVDIDPVTYNLVPELVAGAITERTRAIMPVHLFGRCAEMDPILAIAADAGLPVIEDAAQSIGATLGDRPAGSMGLMGCLSFFPSKNLGGIGDGGMVLTQDAEVAERLRILRGHGARPKYFHHVVGGNFRLDAIDAAVLRVKLPHLDAWSAGRAAVADRYCALLREAGLVADGGPVTALPADDDRGRQIFNQYVIRVSRRDELQQHLAAAGIATAVYYPRPLNLQPCFAYLEQGEGSFPEAERASRETLALPMFPELPREHQREVVEQIAAFYARG